MREFVDDFLHGARAVVACLVQDDSVHVFILSSVSQMERIHFSRWPPCVSNGCQRKKIVVPPAGMRRSVLPSEESDVVHPAAMSARLFFGRPEIATSDVAST